MGFRGKNGFGLIEKNPCISKSAMHFILPVAVQPTDPGESVWQIKRTLCNGWTARNSGPCTHTSVRPRIVRLLTIPSTDVTESSIWDTGLQSRKDSKAQGSFQGRGFLWDDRASFEDRGFFFEKDLAFQLSLALPEMLRVFQHQWSGYLQGTVPDAPNGGVDLRSRREVFQQRREEWTLLWSFSAYEELDEDEEADFVSVGYMYLKQKADWMDYVFVVFTGASWVGIFWIIYRWCYSISKTL